MRSRLARVGVYGLGLSTLIVAIQTHVTAGFVVDVPEIDGGSISTGLGILAAGILLLRSRRR